MSEIRANQVQVTPMLGWDGFGFTFINKMPHQIEVMQPIVPPVYNVMLHGGTAYTGVSHTPSFWLNRESVQAMFDAMHEAGLRPSQGEPKSNRPSEDARLMHLSDLRAIAFALLRKHGVEFPEPILSVGDIEKIKGSF